MTKKAPTSDNRNQTVTVYDEAGKAHELSLTNAREMVKHRNWTMDQKEAAKRAAEPVAPAPVSNEGSNAAPPPPAAPKIETPVWEDLSTLNKIELRAAAAYLKVPDIDGRSSEKRIVASIDTLLDSQLTASGDFVGADPLPQGASPEEIAAHQTAAVARRRRAYGRAATAAALAFGDEATLASLVGSFAALAEPATA